MTVFTSRCRPWLEHVGPWDVGELEDSEREALGRSIRDAAATADQELRRQYGTEANVFGAASFVRRLIDAPFDDESLFRLAMNMAAVAYYRERASVPRAAIGGTTNPTNRKRWSALRPWLLERAGDAMAQGLSDALLVRAVYAAGADQPLLSDLVARRIRKQFTDTGMFEAVNVQVDTRLKSPGGRRRLDQETRASIDTIKSALADDDPVLIEVLRDPGQSPIAAQTLIIFRLEEGAEGRLIVTGFDATEKASLVRFELRDDDARVAIYEDTPGDYGVAPRGIRIVKWNAVPPPLFGPRRLTRYLLPWRLFWWLRRRWTLLTDKKRSLRWQGKAEPATLPKGPEQIAE